MTTFEGRPNTPTVEACAESLLTKSGRGHARMWSTRPGKFNCAQKLAVLGYAYAYAAAPEGFLTYQAIAETAGIDKDAVKAMIREWWEYHTRPVGVQDVKAVMKWCESAP